MDNRFRENLLEELGRRARLSMAGKGMIGLIGGTMLLIVTWFRNCNKREGKLESSNVEWFRHEVQDLSITLDSNKRVAHFHKLGIDSSMADSVASFIESTSMTGTLVHELNNHEVDSFNNKFNLSIPNTLNQEQVNFYVHSDTTDYIIAMSDSLIQSIVAIPSVPAESPE